MILVRIRRDATQEIWFKVLRSPEEMAEAAATLIAEYGEEFTVSCVTLSEDPRAKPPWALEDWA